MPDSLVKTAQPEQDPAQRIDDGAILRLRGDGLFDHRQRLIEVLAPFDQRIPQIVEHLRLAGVERERAAEIGLGGGPVVELVQGDAAGIENQPERRIALGIKRERTPVGGIGVAVALFAAQAVAQRHMDGGEVGVAAGELLEHFYGGIVAPGPAQRGHPAEFCRVKGRIVARDAVEGGIGQVELPHLVEQPRRGEDCIGMGGVEVEGDMQIGRDQRRPGFALKRGRDGKQRLGHAFAGILHHVKGQRIAFHQCVAQGGEARVDPRAKDGVDTRDGVGVAAKLAEHLRIGDRRVAGPRHAILRWQRKDRLGRLEVAHGGKRQRLVVKAKSTLARRVDHLVKG